MATKGNTVLSLVDWAKRLDPDGSVPDIVELLKQTNGILDDMVFMQGNLPTGHRITVRTGLPEVYWKILNVGTPTSKSETAQIDEGMGKMEAWSEVDVDLAKLNGNTPEFRLSEARAFIQAMNIRMARTLFYGNSSTDPEEFNGLSVRFSDKSAGNAENIVDAGGTGSNNTSMWVLDWSEQSLFGTFPKGSTAGIEHEDKGKVTLETAGGSAQGRRNDVYRDKWSWYMGLAQKDWNWQVRVANIDIPNLKTASPEDITELLIKATHRLPSMDNLNRCRIYMNRTLLQYLDIQRLRKVSQSGITYEEIDGKYVPMFRGIPIRRTDALLNTESRVV